MTLPAQNPSQSFVAALGQTVFPFTFRCDSSLVVTAYSNDVALGPGDFAIALNADQVAAPGGTITLTVAAALGDIITVERASPQTQVLAMTAYQLIPTVDFMAALDRVVELLQEFAALLVRAITVSRAGATKLSSLQLPIPNLGQLIGWVDGGGGKYKLGNIAVPGVVVGTTRVTGEPLTDSGDHTNFTSAHAPAGTDQLLFRNGGRIFLGDDYTRITNTWTLIVPLGAGEKLNADYSF